MRAAQDALSELDAQAAAVEGDIREKEDEIAGLQVGHTEGGPGGGRLARRGAVGKGGLGWQRRHGSGCQT